MSATQKSGAEQEEILKELCVCNGLSYSRLAQEGQSCVRIEMFFTGFSKMLGLQHFPNLQVLCIVGQPIDRIQGLTSTPKLKELWLAECQIQKMEGLNGLKHLRRLYLYSNCIKRIENIDQLKDLEKIYLNNNEITLIEGLGDKRYLREVNLAENMIDQIGNTLNGLPNLGKLELSGNKIFTFKDLYGLARLPKLVELGLCSAQFNPCPVSMLCNYTTNVIYQLPNLLRLDGRDVSGKGTKDLAENTVVKKKMYYTMRRKVVLRHLATAERRLRDIHRDFLKGPEDRIRLLCGAIQEVKRELQEVRNEDIDGESASGSNDDSAVPQGDSDESLASALNLKRLRLRNRAKKWEKRITELNNYHKESNERLRLTAEVSISRLTTELETGGNVRFEDGKISDACHVFPCMWYLVGEHTHLHTRFTPCIDLVLSRFCAADFTEHGIVGIKVHRVTKVYNRILHSRFEEAVAMATGEEDSSVTSAKPPSYKRLVEYLFWVWDPDLPGCRQEPDRVVETGFKDSQTYEALGREAAVPLSNSLSLADRWRIKYTTAVSRDGRLTDTCPHRFGQLIIAKVYIGKTAAAGSKAIQQKFFLNVDSVFRQNKSDPSKIADLKVTCCECRSRQCEWFVFNRDFAMPEYIVNFEYVTKEKAPSPYMDSYPLTEEGHLAVFPAPLEELSSDDDVMKMVPEVKPRPRLATLSEEIILKLARVSSMSQVTMLNLHGGSLTKLKLLQSLNNLRRLNVSFNELTRLDGLAHMDLEHLDATFNKISTLEGVKAMNKLRHLDLSSNELWNTREEISILRKHCPVLSTLDVRRNPWQKPDGFRLRAIGRLRTLTRLNKAPVTDLEAASALRLAAGSRVSQVSLLAHTRTDARRPRCLSLFSTAHALAEVSRERPDRMSDSDDVWYSKVTCLNLDGQHLSKLSNLERLENLRWASFSDNHITRIEGLDGCLHLEELTLENNCISKIEGLSRLSRLQKLNLDHNYIATLENSSLDQLKQLRHLSLDGNLLQSLRSLQRCSSLLELFLGNNRLDNIREVFSLKDLSQLIILDLGGNDVALVTDYRLFVIYHVKSLKALDGTPVENCEGGQAKDTFGGRLTQDFVAERLGHASFGDVRELDFPQAGIRSVDLEPGGTFNGLRSVNLEHNNLTSFSGLVFLVNLRVLCLNHNHVECIVPKSRQQRDLVASKARSGNGAAGGPGAQPFSAGLLQQENYIPLMEHLVVLHLGYNGVRDMAALQLNRLPSLKALFLQGNEITKIDGLDGLQDLRELVLDRNKIKNVGEHSFVNQWNLQELHMEENRIKDLANFHPLENLQRLFLGMNRIQEIAEMEKLESLERLTELSVISNPAARRMLHRPMLVFRMPSLTVVDGIPITEDERSKADLYFMEQQPPQLLPASMETMTSPGLGQYKGQMPVKVTNVQLMSGSGAYPDRMWDRPAATAEDTLQQEIQRGAPRRRHPPRTDTLPTGGSTTTLLPAKGSNSQQRVLGHVPYVPHQSGHHDYGTQQDGHSRLARNGRR